MKKFIVKVQLSMFSSEDDMFVLVYNKDRTMEHNGDATPEILDLMDGEVKKFFYAKKVDGFIELLDEAPWQSW